MFFFFLFIVIYVIYLCFYAKKNSIEGIKGSGVGGGRGELEGISKKKKRELLQNHEIMNRERGKEDFFFLKLT